MGGLGIVGIVLIIAAVVVILKTAIVVPQQEAYVVQRFGKYYNVLESGIHILLPFIDSIAYRHSLKEHAYDIPRQICITKDNVQVEIDGVIYMQVLDPVRASYGISNYAYAITQLAQTTLRSEIGKIELDKTFEERAVINRAVVTEVDKAAEPWGVKVLRYEIQNIIPPADILAAMEKQMRAEREKRALVLESEGLRDSEINRAEGAKQRAVKESEGRKLSQINEAEGEAAAILSVANATAEGIAKVAESLKLQGGDEAMSLRIAEQYIAAFGKLAEKSNTMVLSADVANIGSMITMAKGLMKDKEHKS